MAEPILGRWQARRAQSIMSLRASISEHGWLVLEDDLRVWQRASTPEDAATSKSVPSRVLPAGTTMKVLRRFKLGHGGAPNMAEVVYFPPQGDAGAGLPTRAHGVVRWDDLRNVAAFKQMDHDKFVSVDSEGREYPCCSMHEGELDLKKMVGPADVPEMSPADRQQRVDALLDRWNKEPEKREEIERHLRELRAFHALFMLRRADDINLYHGTSENFDDAKLDTERGELGAHWGTPEQVNDRLDEGGNLHPIVNDEKKREKHLRQMRRMRVIPADIDIKNPLRMRDVGHFDVYSIAGQLMDAGIIDEQEWEDIQKLGEKDRNRVIQSAVVNAGYDGIVYLNRREGIGPVTPEGEAMREKMGHDDFDLESSDEQFLQAHPQAKDSYIVFEKSQIHNRWAARRASSPAPYRLSVDLAAIDDDGTNVMLRSGSLVTFIDLAGAVAGVQMCRVRSDDGQVYLVDFGLFADNAQERRGAASPDGLRVPARTTTPSECGPRAAISPSGNLYDCYMDHANWFRKHFGSEEYPAGWVRFNAVADLCLSSSQPPTDQQWSTMSKLLLAAEGSREFFVEDMSGATKMDRTATVDEFRRSGKRLPEFVKAVKYSDLGKIAAGEHDHRLASVKKAILELLRKGPKTMAGVQDVLYTRGVSFHESHAALSELMKESLIKKDDMARVRLAPSGSSSGDREGKCQCRGLYCMHMSAEENDGCPNDQSGGNFCDSCARIIRFKEGYPTQKVEHERCSDCLQYFPATEMAGGTCRNCRPAITNQGPTHGAPETPAEVPGMKPAERQKKIDALLDRWSKEPASRPQIEEQLKSLRAFTHLFMLRRAGKENTGGERQSLLRTWLLRRADGAHGNQDDRGHDYDFGWDYEVQEKPDAKLTQMAEAIAADLMKTLIPKLKMFGGFEIGYLENSGSVAVFIASTASYPMIGIDLPATQEAMAEFPPDYMAGALRTSIVHELAHAIQEFNDLPYNEEEAEGFARDFEDMGTITEFWKKPKTNRGRKRQSLLSTWLSRRAMKEGPLGWFQDNPLTWMEGDRGRLWIESHPKTTTAGFNDIFLPVDFLITIPGERGEHDNIDEPNVERIVDWMTKSKDPIGVLADAKPFIMVNSTGQATIFEGNHRVRAAKKMGLESIPVWVHYEGGSEMIDGPFSPDKLRAMSGNVTSSVRGRWLLRRADMAPKKIKRDPMAVMDEAGISDPQRLVGDIWVAFTKSGAREHRDHQITSIHLTGSRWEGRERPDSDLDVIVFHSGQTLMSESTIAFREKVSEMTGGRVDAMLLPQTESWDHPMSGNIMTLSNGKAEANFLRSLRAAKATDWKKVERLMKQHWGARVKEDWAGGLDCTGDSEALNDLLHAAGMPAEHVSSYYRDAKGNLWSHDWLQLDGKVIDITHSQFGKPDYLIADVGDPRYPSMESLSDEETAKANPSGIMPTASKTNHGPKRQSLFAAWVDRQSARDLKVSQIGTLEYKGKDFYVEVSTKDLTEWLKLRNDDRIIHDKALGEHFMSLEQKIVDEAATKIDPGWPAWSAAQVGVHDDILWTDIQRILEYYGHEVAESSGNLTAPGGDDKLKQAVFSMFEQSNLKALNPRQSADLLMNMAVVLRDEFGMSLEDAKAKLSSLLIEYGGGGPEDTKDNLGGNIGEVHYNSLRDRWLRRRASEEIDNDWECDDCDHLRHDHEDPTQPLWAVGKCLAAGCPCAKFGNEEAENAPGPNHGPGCFCQGCVDKDDMGTHRCPSCGSKECPGDGDSIDCRRPGTMTLKDVPTETRDSLLDKFNRGEIDEATLRRRMKQIGSILGKWLLRRAESDNRSDLQKMADQIHDFIKANPMAQMPEIAAHIEKLWGYKREGKYDTYFEGAVSNALDYLVSDEKRAKWTDKGWRTMAEPLMTVEEHLRGVEVAPGSQPVENVMEGVKTVDPAAERDRLLDEFNKGTIDKSTLDQKLKHLASTRRAEKPTPKFDTLKEGQTYVTKRSIYAHPWGHGSQHGFKVPPGVTLTILQMPEERGWLVRFDLAEDFIVYDNSMNPYHMRKNLGALGYDLEEAIYDVNIDRVENEKPQPSGLGTMDINDVSVQDPKQRQRALDSLLDQMNAEADPAKKQQIMERLRSLRASIRQTWMQRRAAGKLRRYWREWAGTSQPSVQDAAKKAFHKEATRVLKILATALGLQDGGYDLRSNKGGSAVMGEVTLHSDDIYVQVGGSSQGLEVMYRTVNGRGDYSGGKNNWMKYEDVENATDAAAKIGNLLNKELPNRPKPSGAKGAMTLETERGARYEVLSNGNIVRLDIKGFEPSGQWKLVGIESPNGAFIPFEAFISHGLPESVEGWTIIDFDHGTTRAWGEKLRAISIKGNPPWENKPKKAPAAPAKPEPVEQSAPNLITAIEDEIINLLRRGPSTISRDMNELPGIDPRLQDEVTEVIGRMLDRGAIRFDGDTAEFSLLKEPEATEPEHVPEMSSYDAQQKIDALLDQMNAEQDPAKKKQIEQRIRSLQASQISTGLRLAGEPPTPAPGGVKECSHGWPGKKDGERGWCGRCQLGGAS